MNVNATLKITFLFCFLSLCGLFIYYEVTKCPRKKQVIASISNKVDSVDENQRLFEETDSLFKEIYALHNQELSINWKIIELQANGHFNNKELQRQSNELKQKAEPLQKRYELKYQKYKNYQP